MMIGGMIYKVFIELERMFKETGKISSHLVRSDFSTEKQIIGWDVTYYSD